MTRKELKVGQIIHDEKENSYLVYSIDDKNNSVRCLDKSFTNAAIGFSFLNYFHAYDEINLDLLISELLRKHPEADMSNANKIIFNGKVYLAAGKVLEIIHKLDNENMGFPDWSHEYETACTDFRTEVIALLKGDENESTTNNFNRLIKLH